LSKYVKDNVKKSVSFINDFLNIIDSEMNILLGFCQNSDYENIYSQAHKLKGLCANMYFDQLTHIFKEMEQNAKNNTTINYIDEYYKSEKLLNRYDFYMEFKK
jgi:HPt (histidine-containing phosphotransfer) domain-containing protein